MNIHLKLNIESALSHHCIFNFCVSEMKLYEERGRVYIWSRQNSLLLNAEKYHWI